MKQLITSTIEGFRVGEPITYRNLCVFPLFAGEDLPPVYMSLKTALEKKLVEITEVSESGSVPNLKVANHADEPVLLIDGEELAGAKQNRIVNTSLLMAPKTETIIPVSCTEQGRWRYSSPAFMESGVMMTSGSRYRKSMRVSGSLKSFNKYDADQSSVWGDVREMHSLHQTSSSTGAMKDVYEQKEGDMKDFVDAFPLLDDQKGLIVFLNGKLTGLDYISRFDVYKDLHLKLVKSHIADALHRETGLFDPVNLEIEVHLFLKALAGTTGTDEFKPAGLGTDVRFDSDAAGGAALVHEDTVIHLTAFNKPGIDQNSGTPVENPREWELTNRLRRRMTSFLPQ